MTGQCALYPDYWGCSLSRDVIYVVRACAPTNDAVRFFHTNPPFRVAKAVSLADVYSVAVLLLLLLQGCCDSV